MRRDRVVDALARRIVARLPLAVAAIDSDARLLYWNDQASVLFRCPPLRAAERPDLATMLGRVGMFTQPQRERIAHYAMAQIAAGDRVEPDGCLQLSPDRGCRVSIKVQGLGDRHWMLVFNDSRASGWGSPAAPGTNDAWLDALTGLSSRRHFDVMLQQTLDGASVDRRQAVLLIDIDHFSHVNEAHGRQTGDALLCLIAQRLRRETRDDDVLARFGGDEIALLLPNGDGAEALSARVIAILAQPFMVEGQRVSISASVGLVRIDGPGIAADALIRHAELAVQQAKSAGGQTWCLFDQAMLREARDRRELANDLRKALASRELSVDYQPWGDLAARALAGFEARPRWDHPVRGLVPASALLDLAETSGLIVELGEWALQQACSDAMSWPEPAGSAPLTVDLALSPGLLQDPGRLVASVMSALEASRLPPARLGLKIPPPAAANGPPPARTTLDRLEALGVRILPADGLASAPFAAPCGYIGSSLTSTAGIAEVLHHYAPLSNSDPKTE